MSGDAPTAVAAARSGGWRGITLALLGAAGGLHLVYLLASCPLDLSGDEAHYWEWSRRLDLSYYSKGPLVAYIIAAGRWVLGGLSQRLLGNEALAVRGPAIVLSFLTGWGLFELGVLTLRRPALACAAVALSMTLPILAVGALLMTIDAPLACCYVWALVACQRGLERGSPWAWLAAGVLIALGILAKYTMVLIFPAVGLALLAAPDYRRQLRRAGPWLATVIGLLGLAPILWWNAQHGWVSFRHVAGQAGLAGKTSFDALGPVELVLGQFAVIGVVWFPLLVMATAAALRWRGRGAPDPPYEGNRRLLVCAALTPWVAFLAFSLVTKVQPNWPVLAVFPALLLAVAWLVGARRRGRADRKRANAVIVAGVLTGGALVVILHRTEWLMPVFGWLARHEPAWNPTPVGKYDPTARLRGWTELGAAVGRHLAAEHAAGRDPFIAADDYQTASEIAFYCPGQPRVYCFQAALGDRLSQYDLWENPLRDAERFVGRPCIYVGARQAELFGGPGVTQPALHGAVTPIEIVEHRVRGHAVQIWPIYVCAEFAGFGQGPDQAPERY